MQSPEQIHSHFGKTEVYDRQAAFAVITQTRDGKTAYLSPDEPQKLSVTEQQDGGAAIAENSFGTLGKALNAAENYQHAHDDKTDTPAFTFHRVIARTTRFPIKARDLRALMAERVMAEKVRSGELELEPLIKDFVQKRYGIDSLQPDLQIPFPDDDPEAVKVELSAFKTSGMNLDGEEISSRTPIDGTIDSLQFFENSTLNRLAKDTDVIWFEKIETLMQEHALSPEQIRERLKQEIMLTLPHGIAQTLRENGEDIIKSITATAPETSLLKSDALYIGKEEERPERPVQKATALIHTDLLEALRKRFSLYTQKGIETPPAIRRVNFELTTRTLTAETIRKISALMRLKKFDMKDNYPYGLQRELAQELQDEQPEIDDVIATFGDAVNDDGKHLSMWVYGNPANISYGDDNNFTSFKELISSAVSVARGHRMNSDTVTISFARATLGDNVPDEKIEEVLLAHTRTNVRSSNGFQNYLL